MSLRGRFFRLSGLNILSNFTVPLAGLVDTAMLGHLPDIRFLAGVALCGVVFDYLYWSFGFLRMSTTGVTAQHRGAGRRDEMFLTLYRALLWSVAFGVALLVLHVPVRDLAFALLPGEPGVEQAGIDYYNARIWGAPAVLCNFALIGWLLGREESRLVLAMTVVANTANIFFNYLFIVRFGWAAHGAGLATMLGQYLMLAVGALFLLGSKPARFHWHAVLDHTEMRVLIRLNRDILIRTLCLVSAFAGFTGLSALFGTANLAVNSLILRLLTVASYTIDGAAFASESLAGIFRGQRALGELKRLFRLSLAAGWGFAAVFLVVLFSAPRPLLELLTSHDDIVASTLSYLPWLVPVLAFGASAYMYDGLFIGLTEGRAMRNAMIVSTLFVFVPLALLAVWLRDNHLLWGSMVAYMLARSASLAWASRERMRHYATWETGT